MLDNTFDPYDAIITIDKNIKALIQAHNGLAQRVEEQQQTIDVLIKGLNAANAVNQQLLAQSLDRFTATTQGQH